MEPNIELSKTRDFGEIIADSFLFIKQNFKPLLSCFFVFCGFFLLAGLVTGIMEQIRVVDLLNNAASETYGPVSTRSRFGHIFELGTILTLVFALLSHISLVLAIMCFMTLYKQKGNIAPTNAEVWEYFKFFFFRVLGGSVLNFIIFVVGLVFCLIPGLYLLPALSLMLPIMVVENTTYGYAFNQSFRLVKESWWMIFGALFIIYLVIVIIGSIASVPFAVVSVWSMFLHQVKYVHMSITAVVLGTFMRQLIQALNILMVVTAMICYYSLNEEKESTGLMGRIDQLGTEHTDTNAPTEEY